MVDVSVVVTTYNGDQYISEQLESILNQERKPNEVIIVDDCSSDTTPEIISEYSSRHSDIINVFENEENMGIAKNIEKGLNIASGDIIAISDQDDVWHEKKLMAQVDILKHEDCDLVFHNSKLFSKNEDINSTLWEKLKISPIQVSEEGDLFNKLLYRNFIQGATMAFKQEVLEYVLPIPKETKYDYFIALCVAGCGHITGIDRSLLKYRQHNNQQIGAETGGLIERIFNYRIPDEDEIQQEIKSKYITSAEASKRLKLCGAQKRDYTSLMEFKSHYKSRCKIYQDEKSGMPYIISNIKRYRSYDNYNSVVADLVHNSIFRV